MMNLGVIGMSVLTFNIYSAIVNIPNLKEVITMAGKRRPIAERIEEQQKKL